MALPSADPTPGGVSARLWATARPAALALLHNHPFIRRLADGSLDDGAWNRFVSQDAAFLHAFKQAYAAAAAAATATGDDEAAATCRRLAASVDDELKLHAACGAAPVSTLPATDAYCAFLAQVCESPRDVVTILTAMAPCSRLYGWLGVRLKEAGADGGARSTGAAWIDTYAGAAYHAAPQAKEALLDRLVAASQDAGLEGEFG